MSKQDRQGVRTASHLEQKYNFGEKFSQLMGISNDTRMYVDSVESELRNEFKEQITAISRDTEKIIMTALENYVETGEFEEFEKTMDSEFLLMADRISMNLTSTTDQIVQVQGDLEAVEGEVSEQAENTEKLWQYFESEMLLMADRLTLSFQSALDQITSVDGDVQRITETLEKHFIFNTNGLTIKAGDNEVKLVLDNGIVYFELNGQRKTTLEPDSLKTGNIYVGVDEVAQFGNYGFVPYEDDETDGLDFVRVGG